MAISRVIPPKNATMDYDYIAFTFDGKNSYDDFGIIRTGDGDRYNEELLPTAQDITAEVTGGDGTYFFNTCHKQKVFNISFAFDNLNDTKVREMKQWLDGKKVADLWFAENPYKVYSAKVTGQPNIKFVPFDEYNAAGEKIGRVYKGEGSVTFTCYWPYAHTPDYVGTGTNNGKNLNSYLDTDFVNKSQWAGASGLTSSTGTCTGENPGDLPAPFKLTKTSLVYAGNKFQVGDLQITIETSCYNLEWDSKTGLVLGSKTSSGEKIPINFTGESCGGIPVGGTNKLALNGGTLSYHYWYY